MESTTLPDTERLFLQDTLLFTCQAKVVAVHLVQEQDALKHCLVYLDRTVFHPQGGGQPNDQGHLLFQGKSIEVSDLVLSKEHQAIGHKVTLDEHTYLELKKNVLIQVVINEEKRRLYARIHSAGHLLDMAVTRLGYEWQPGKGYHFPSGAYVEYIGAVDPKRVPETIEALNKTCADIIHQTEQPSLIEWIPYDEAKTRMEVPSFLPMDKPIRFIRLSPEDKGCMCGGTHVQHINTIKAISIKKINKKGKCVRVAYEVAA